MGGNRPQLMADLRRLPLEERKRRLREILDRIQREGPTPELRGKTADEIVQMVKRTREEIWKEKLAARS
ncbi:MAG: hypothetical protein AAB152_07445 [Candidatus Coatesbacteria bacterium]